MTTTQALTPYTCVLACLESYFTDIAFPYDQCRLLRECKAFCMQEDPEKQHEFGAMNPIRLELMLSHLGFAVGHAKDFREEAVRSYLASLAIDETALIWCRWKKQDMHCLRFAGWEGPTISLMSPGFYQPSTIETVSFAELVEFDFAIWRVGKRS